MSDKYGKDYFEDGIRKGISGYFEYHYIPTRSISEAISIVEKIDFQTVIEFGCAKGYLLNALSLLGKEVIGIDISEYAIENCLPQMKDKLFLIKEDDDWSWRKADLVIAKDVLEHLDEKQIEDTLSRFYKMCHTLFIVVPLGEKSTGCYRIREYEIDKTHVTREDEEWWINKIRQAGFKLKSFSYKFGDVKANWADHKYGNGFFVATK